MFNSESEIFSFPGKIKCYYQTDQIFKIKAGAQQRICICPCVPNPETFKKKTFSCVLCLDKENLVTLESLSSSQICQFPAFNNSNHAYPFFGKEKLFKVAVFIFFLASCCKVNKPRGSGFGAGRKTPRHLIRFSVVFEFHLEGVIHRDLSL